MAWDAETYAEEMKRSTYPVSAFFLIDSLDAIARCAVELDHLREYGIPDMRRSRYFAHVREVFESGREVINVDCPVAFRWKGRRIPGVIRLHSVDAGRYEVEVWIPGVIASRAAAMFKDGYAGFCCAFMAPAFYD